MHCAQYLVETWEINLNICVTVKISINIYVTTAVNNTYGSETGPVLCLPFSSIHMQQLHKLHNSAAHREPVHLFLRCPGDHNIGNQVNDNGQKD